MDSEEVVSGLVEVFLYENVKLKNFKLKKDVLNF
jgi:hypothetical protein